MSSALLYYGPGAREEALEEAYRLGELMTPPFGDEGLKVEEARAFVEALQLPPFDGIGCVIAGPMDMATPAASDVLLKSIEEFGDYVRPILWAHDLDGVTPTIRSRCLARWAWADPDDQEPDEDSDEIEAAGRSLVHAALNKELWAIPGYVTPHKGKEHQLLNIAAGEISRNPTPEALQLWESLRKVAEHRNPTPIEIIAAFLRSSE